MDKNKYEKAKIYKIWSTKGDNIYIGSTCKKYLCQRMVHHRTFYKIWKTTSLHYTTSFLLFDEYGIDNCFIELIEAKSCTTKDEINQLEGKYIREMKCVNKVIPGRTKHEWNIDNKNHVSNYNKDYAKNNKEQIKQRNARHVTCICGSIINYQSVSRHEKTIKHCQFIESRVKPLQ
jgi:hypothetical protein